MSLDNLKSSDDIVESGDFIGGGGVLDSGLYDMAIDMAYIDESSGGATFISFNFVDANGKRLKQNIYVTGGTDKGAKNYYIDKKTKKKHYLPGFNLVNNICLLSVGIELSELTPEKKTLKIYDYKAKKEIPLEKLVLTELRGQQITLGIIKQTVNKQERVEDGKGGFKYVNTAETKDVNDINKAFRTSDKLTVAEIKGGIEKAVFAGQWDTKYTGVTQNKVEAVTGTSKPLAAGVTNTADSSTPPPVKKLFGS